MLTEHPDVVDVAVIGRPSQEWGESVAALVALGAGVAGSVRSVTVGPFSQSLGRVVIADQWPGTPTLEHDPLWRLGAG